MFQGQKYLRTFAAIVLLTLSGEAIAQVLPPNPTVVPAILPANPIAEPPIIQVQQPAPTTPVTPTTATPTTPTTPTVQTPTGGGNTAFDRLNAATPNTPTSGGGDVPRDTGPGASGPTGPNAQLSGGGGATGAALNASNVGDLLSKSQSSVGVEIQRRNAIVTDARIRGLRSTQYNTIGDGGLFAPARLDLDTAVSKFDPGSIRDIIVVKGPYSALYGPGFSFLDIATIDSPRYDDFQVHGRTSAGYNTNGRRWDGLQSVSVGDKDWGFRGTYNILQGNDYRSGDGTVVPSSYLSNNFNFALGFTLTEKSRIEFKAIRSQQTNVEFPGLYFDIDRQDSEAYSLRYTLLDQGLFDKFTLDTWYNTTAASGSTKSGAKQAFVQKLLAVSFNPALYQTNPGAPGLALNSPFAAIANDPRASLFRDNSNTQFAERSIGYRAAMSWGPTNDPLFTVGTDLNVFGQGLNETIALQQYQGANLNTGAPTSAANPANFSQTQGIPNSNAVDGGIFFQSAIPLTDRWKLRSGGRVDYAYSSSNPRVLTGNVDLFGPPGPRSLTPDPARFSVDPMIYSSNPTDRALSRDFPLLAGFFQSEYKLDDNWTVLAALGHSERAPTLTELYSSGPFVGVLQQGTSRLIGDPNLRTEKLTQFDVGLTAKYETFQAGVTGFYGLINDYITYDQNRGGSGLTQVVYTNTDRASLAGVELFSQADVTAWLTPFASLSYVQGYDLTANDRRRSPNLASSRRDDPLTLSRKSSTEPLAQIPPLESKLGFRIHQASKAPKWQVEFSARVVADQNNVATSLGEQQTSGFTVFNIRGYWKARENLLITTGVENLGDKNYREHLDPISGNILGSGALLRPGANFFFNTQVSY